MIFPKISKYVIYRYDGQFVILWQQDLFRKVYLRTVPQNNGEGSYYTTANWWKFMLFAHFDCELEHNENSPY